MRAQQIDTITHEQTKMPLTEYQSEIFQKPFQYIQSKKSSILREEFNEKKLNQPVPDMNSISNSASYNLLAT